MQRINCIEKRDHNWGARKFLRFSIIRNKLEAQYALKVSAQCACMSVGTRTPECRMTRNYCCELTADFPHTSIIHALH